MPEITLRVGDDDGEETLLPINVSRRQRLWGARIDGNAYSPPLSGSAPFQLAPWDKFEDSTHFNKKIGWLQWGVSRFMNIVPGDLQKVRDRGAIPHIEFNLKKGDGTLWTFAAILRGEADALIDAFAQKAATWGYPFVCRMWHEMNGPWMQPEGIYGDPVGFVSAWEYVVSRVRPIAPNCSFMWCCNGWSADGKSKAKDATPYLANPELIDLWGLDTYRNNPITYIGDPAYQLFLSTDPFKPILWEFGYDVNDTRQAEKMKACLDLLHDHYSEIDAINFFHRQDTGSFSASDQLSQRTFDYLRPVIADSFYRAQAPLGDKTQNVSDIVTFYDS